MNVSFFTLNGLPDGITVPLTGLFFLILIAPLFSGYRIFNTQFPALTRLGKFVASGVGGVGLILMLVGFQPAWRDEQAMNDMTPYCFIYSNNRSASEGLLISWLVESKIEAWSTLTLNGNFESSETSGSKVFEDSSLPDPASFVVTAGNRYGACSKTLVIQSRSGAASSPPKCNLSINKARASDGEAYVLSWEVTGPEGTRTYINGASVENSGQANWVFGSENYERFHLAANSNGLICEAHARIIAR